VHDRKNFRSVVIFGFDGARIGEQSLDVRRSCEKWARRLGHGKGVELAGFKQRVEILILVDVVDPYSRRNIDRNMLGAAAKPVNVLWPNAEFMLQETTNE
jgi:hypothetical protein